jgi:outer membrane immunogenic protein
MLLAGNTAHLSLLRLTVVNHFRAFVITRRHLIRGPPMKHFQPLSLCVLSTIGAIALCGAGASAADLGAPIYKAPPPSPPVHTWTGFYVGANGGFGGDRFQYPFTFGAIPALGVGPTTGTAALNSSGFFGGGQVGFNWQAAQSWVLGVEADFDEADIEGIATTSANTFSGNVGTKLDWFGTVRGRAGFLVTPQALLYGTGGWAYGHTTSSANAAAFGLTVGTSAGQEQNGWTAGGGLEYAFNPWLSFKTEYLYLNLGTANLAGGTLAGGLFSLSEKTTVHTVKAGLNFKLGAW